MQHHRDLQLLTTRQLQDAVRRSQSRDTSDCVTAGDKHGKAPQVHLRYFTGQLSHEAINGVAHLEIRSRDDTGGDPDIADMLQCELVRLVICCRVADSSQPPASRAANS